MRKTTRRYTFEQTAATIGDSGSSVRNATSTAIGSSVDERESCSIVERRDGARTARRRGNRHRHRRGRRFERFVYQRISRARQSVRRPREKKKETKKKERARRSPWDSRPSVCTYTRRRYGIHTGLAVNAEKKKKRWSGSWGTTFVVAREGTSLLNAASSVRPYSPTVSRRTNRLRATPPRSKRASLSRICTIMFRTKW